MLPEPSAQPTWRALDHGLGSRAAKIKGAVWKNQGGEIAAKAETRIQSRNNSTELPVILAQAGAFGRFAVAPREAVRLPPIMSLGVRLRPTGSAAVELAAWIASELGSSSRVTTNNIRDAGQGEGGPLCI
jgi:hypothetical protein